MELALGLIEADPVTVRTYFLAPKKHSTTSNFPCEVPTEALPHQNLCDFWECWMSNSPYITKYFLITSCIPTLYWTNYSFPEEKKELKKTLKFSKPDANVSRTHLS